VLIPAAYMSRDEERLGYKPEVILRLYLFSLHKKTKYKSYQERWRDWPYETQQPVLF